MSMTCRPPPSACASDPRTPSGGGPHAGSERGIALLLVMLLMLILLPFAYEFTTQVQLEAKTAVNVTDQLKIDNAIDGQYEIMLAHLLYDANENEIDSLSDAWNDEKLTNRVEDAVNVALTTHVFDEQGKFNIRMLSEGPQERRALAKERLMRLLVEFRRDADFELGSSEAESWANGFSEYMNNGAVRANIPRPRMADDRTILLLDELNLLPKVHDKRFEFLLHDQREADRVSPGLHRHVTIYGTGKVNLNTCSMAVLKAYFPKNPELAERIIERRDNPPEEEEDGLDAEGGGGTGNPYTDVMQITQVEGVTPQALQDNRVDPALDFEVRSHVFSLRIVGETDSTRRDELFVVERVPGASEDDPLEGFRLLLRQERTDALEHVGELE